MTVDGEPWFVAKDVCAVLGIANSRMAVSRIDADGVSTADVIDSMGRTQAASVVNESGLYDLVLDSRAPQARAFRRWITPEVIPSIRKTGRYEAAPQIPQSLPEALRAYADEVEAHQETRTRVAELEPVARPWPAS